MGKVSTSGATSRGEKDDAKATGRDNAEPTFKKSSRGASDNVASGSVDSITRQQELILESYKASGGKDDDARASGCDKAEPISKESSRDESDNVASGSVGSITRQQEQELRVESYVLSRAAIEATESEISRDEIIRCAREELHKDDEPPDNSAESESAALPPWVSSRDGSVRIQAVPAFFTGHYKSTGSNQGYAHDLPRYDPDTLSQPGVFRIAPTGSRIVPPTGRTEIERADYPQQEFEAIETGNSPDSTSVSEEATGEEVSVRRSDVGCLPVAEQVLSPATAGTAFPMDIERKESHRQRHSNVQRFHLMQNRSAVFKVLGILLIIIAGVTTVLLLALPTSDMNNEKAKSPPILQGIPFYTQLSLQDSSSPQAKAYAWLGKDPQLRNYNHERRWQRFVLATIYYATHGEDWLLSRHWLNYNVHECDWFLKAPYRYLENENVGICDNGNSRLRYLVLSNNNLQGSVVPEVSQLQKLLQFDIGNNKLTGTLPTEIGMLSNLESLLLYGDTILRPEAREEAKFSLTGTLPTEIGMLTMLRDLAVAFNYRLRGTIPPTLSKLTKLMGLYILDSGITGTIPEGLSLLTELKVLRLECNKLFGRMPSQFGLLTGLRELRFERNRLNESLPSELGRLTNLNQLGAFDSDFTGTIPDEIWQLTKLSHLSLQGNRLSGTLSSGVGLLTDLELLAVGDNRISGPIPSEIGKLRSLRQFWSQRNMHTGRVQSEMFGLPKLEVVALGGNNISSDFFNGSLPLDYLHFSLGSGLQEITTGLCPIPDSERPEPYLTAACSYGRTPEMAGTYCSQAYGC